MGVNKGAIPPIKALVLGYKLKHINDGIDMLNDRKTGANRFFGPLKQCINRVCIQVEVVGQIRGNTAACKVAHVIQSIDQSREIIQITQR